MGIFSRKTTSIGPWMDHVHTKVGELQSEYEAEKAKLQDQHQARVTQSEADLEADLNALDETMLRKFRGSLFGN